MTPREESAYSGRVLLRLPRSLHAALAAEADREGVALNALMLTKLACNLNNGLRRAPDARADAGGDEAK